MGAPFHRLRQHRTIPALRLKHRSGSCGTASALPKCSIMSGCGTRIVLRGQKPLALCDRCPCFGSLFPPLAALTFAASSIICAPGLASAAPRSPYRHLELCGIALNLFIFTAGHRIVPCRFYMYPIVYHVLHDKSIFHRQIRNFYTCPGKFCWNGARAFFWGCFSLPGCKFNQRIKANPAKQKVPSPQRYCRSGTS